MTKYTHSLENCNKKELAFDLIKWLEAVPLADMTAKSCACALLRHWVARYGVPDTIVTDRGRQFTSDLWSALTTALGITKKQTTSYHPQSNGMIERQHRTLKERLVSRACASGSSSWMQHLPFVLLGLRSAVREDSACSPADILYGTSLRLPGPMMDSSSSSSASTPPISDFVGHLRDVMRASAPMPVVHHGTARSRVDPALLVATHVFVRVDAVRRPLVAPYDGPFPVLSRADKTFVLLRRDKPVTVSVDRLKPAATLPELTPDFNASPAVAVDAAKIASAPPDCAAPGVVTATSDIAAAPASALPSLDIPPPLDPVEWPLPTRSGRRPRPPDRLNL